jgi:hypothetical protein
LRCPSESGIGFEEFIILAQRDARAPNYPLDLCPATGIAEKEGDWLYPKRLVVNEFSEEVIIINKEDKSWYRPRYDNEMDTELSARMITASEDTMDIVNAESSSSQEKFTRENFRDVFAELIPLGEDVISVSWRGISNSTIGQIVISSEVGAIDLVFAIKIIIPVPFSKLELRDGERNGGKLLNRKVFALKPDQLKNLLEGNPFNAFFFGKDTNNNTCKGKEYKLSNNWQVNIPGFPAGIQVIKRLYPDLARNFQPHNKVKSNSSKAKLDPFLQAVPIDNDYEEN